MNKQQNTQQPVAWIKEVEDDLIGVVNKVVAENPNNPTWTPLYTAPQVPRDVLMAALGEINTNLMNVSGACFSDEYIAAIAERYASKEQPELVNQRTLAALEALVAIADNGCADAWRGEWDDARAAIAAAEAVPDEQQRANWQLIVSMYDNGTPVQQKGASGMAIETLRAMLSAAQKPEGGE